MNDSTGQVSHDPITLEIIQNSLQAVADEMFATMRKTAMSSIIYEVLDMGTGILDARGRIASSGAGIPSFVGVLDKAVQVLLAKFPQETIQPGDVFITNDPYYGGVTHLNDLVVAMPVFAEGRLIAWTANIAHNSDVGGMAPGSLSVQATEIFQEGLRLPAIRLIDAGEANESVFAILRCNSRMPNFLEGDLWAAIAAVRIGARRLTELATKYGVATFETAMEGFMTFGEKVTLSTLASLPHGTFELDEEQDDGRVYNVKVTISPTEFVVDLRNNPDQDIGPTNTSRDGAMICAQMMLKALCDPHSPANDGTFRPIRLLTREGSVFHAREPAAIGFYFETEVRVFDLIWRCLAQHMPERLGAGHFATIGGTFIGGIHPDTGRQYTIIEPQIGGWGGREGHDGNSALFSGFHGETYNCPAEISEARNGLHIGRMALHTGPGGEGQWCGGRGIVIDYGVRQDNSFLTIGYTRSRIMPWSLKEGHEGTGNYALILRRDGTQERHAFVSGLRVDKGDVIRIVTGTGGGYGNPALRDPALVARDVKNGLITAEHAQRIYTT
ncbi:methylhydantoinase [Gluconacetobacter liquefaciens]|uniref:Hydantoinase B/oxoprolinase family protein n=1 Tax=Gluconacetobacter liquefaciens TaxID=89584 RepID=A0A370GCM9_GLULI|nr:hydantoinase B/oxoprolinase family protein [Gluconacetobacter liquefaciens]MBB2185383.1 hydantoinase B/oxoprolinase family protein [Gluconacetobacter liquefaciens]RDI40829.1 N-methylhydantoinase B [Gluconacetobacter liquefaciens]GEB39445.1 methylhydantoinase [Gluconacetobacter liquefaciens]